MPYIQGATGAGSASSMMQTQMRSQNMAKQTFGAQVVTSTLDTMNGMGSQSGMSAGPITDKQSFGAAVVSSTLDYMNSGGPGSMSSNVGDYGFQKQVLGAAYSGASAIADMYV